MTAGEAVTFRRKAGVTDEVFNVDAIEHGTALVVDAPEFKAIRTLAAGGVIDATQLTLDLDADGKPLPFDKYTTLGGYLGQVNRSCSWWIGDWLLYGEKYHGEEWAQALEVTGLAEHTLLNRMSICRAIPPNRRRVELPFSTHAEVAAMNGRQQTAWLEKAVKNGWTRAELRQAIKDAKAKQTTIDDEVPPAGDADPQRVVEAALRVVNEKQDYGADYLVPREPMAVLMGALGLED